MKRPVTVYLPPELRERLAACAEADGRTVSQYVYLLIRRHLDTTAERTFRAVGYR